MSTVPISRIEASDAPEMVSVLLCCLLFKLGGQITLSLNEIQETHAQFPSIRLALQDVNDATSARLTLTLRSRDHVENDRPHSH